VTNKPTEAGTAREPGSADAEPGREANAEPGREQVVISDERRVDASGKPRTADAGGEQVTVTSQEHAGPTAGQPGKTGQDPADGIKEAAAKDANEASADVVTEVLEEAPTAKPGLGAELESLRSALDERLRDLQRVSAEYANYRKRVERDRGVVTEQATGAVVAALLPILDDLDRAKEHGDLTGPFAAMSEQLSSALAKFGLAGFGEPGDAFDPTRHEAVAHQTSADVTEPTCVGIMRRGYLLGERLLRPALVAVADPE
jgi:molecular chaperone GrpE